MEEEIPSLEELKKLKVVELKARLSSLGLQTSGLKAELIARLHSYFVSVPNPQPTQFQEGGPPEAEPEHAAQEGPIAIEQETHFQEDEDAKPVHVMLPITQTHLPIHHSEQHYPVIVKTENFPHIPAPIVISEERPPLEPQTVVGDNLPVILGF
ncbi:uncharacterized protein LOC110052505 [Orbicella faveolata]|uniref:uncharacterized protein LOC110052505 n=1 Tax=Orbicella faveolata TaxID=48498 RepID=UPI0009E49B78|nr:uncharacterized protein LOC110052505 [Orbicella faveolata]